MNGDISVSAMCLTYGRPELLEEAIHSFLIQDYSGEKELVILNDLPEQILEFDHPQVRIINVPKRFRTVGEKRNAAASLASHDVLFVWDDDDIYLPHRLSYSIEMLDRERGFFKPSKALVLNNGVLSGPKSNLFHSGGCWTRALFDAVRGYAHMGSGQDLEIEMAFDKILKSGKNYDAIRPEEIYYIYRWQGTGSYHLSAFGRDKVGGSSGQTKVEAAVLKQLDNKTQRSGFIHLHPKWSLDYAQLVRDYLTLLPKN